MVRPSYRGNFIVYESRGTVKVAKWPAKRPSPRHPTSERWTEWFTQAMILYRAMPSQFLRELRRAGRGNAQFPRDLALASMRGTLWTYTTTEGFTRYPMAAYTKVSASLDTIAQVPGSILVRGAELWTYLPPSAVAGRVLTAGEPGELPSWAETGGGGNYTPPIVSDFPTLIGTPSPTLEQATTGPLTLRKSAAGATANVAGAFKALNTPPGTYTIAVRMAAQLVSARRVGIALRDSNSGRVLTFAFFYNSTTTQPALVIEHWNSPTSFNTQQFTILVTDTAPIFLRIVDDGTNFTFQWSADCGSWSTVTTRPRYNWLVAPDQIGFVIGNTGAESIASTLAVLHYQES